MSRTYLELSGLLEVVVANPFVPSTEDTESTDAEKCTRTCG